MKTWYRNYLLRRRALDADAMTFIAAAGITNATQKTAINTFVLALKSANLWNKCVAIYPFVGGNAVAHSKNLRNPSVNNMTWAGTVTHNANGVTGDGATGYGDTGVKQNVLGQNTAGAFLHSATAAPANKYDFGISGASPFEFIAANASNTVSVGVNCADDVSVANGNGSGVFVFSRTNSSGFNLYVRGAKSTLLGVSVAPSATMNIYFLARLSAGVPTLFSARNFRMFGLLNQALTDADEVALRFAITTFNTTLGR